MVSVVSLVFDDLVIVLVCINVKSVVYFILVGNGCLCINILVGYYEEVVCMIVGMIGLVVEECMVQVGWEIGDYGQLVLFDVLVVLEGDIVLQQQVGMYSVLFVEIWYICLVVLQVDGLVYFGWCFYWIVVEVVLVV